MKKVAILYSSRFLSCLETRRHYYYVAQEHSRNPLFIKVLILPGTERACWTIKGSKSQSFIHQDSYPAAFAYATGADGYRLSQSFIHQGSYPAWTTDSSAVLGLLKSQSFIHQGSYPA